MTRNLRGLGLALVAVFALSAAMVSTASATTDKITLGSGKTIGILTGVSTDYVFKITGAGVEVKCTTTIFKATVTNNTTSVTVEPTYSGRINATPHGPECDANIGTTVKVNMNGCDYDLSGETTGSDGGGTDATISITCPTNHEILIENEICTIKIPAQTPTSGGVTYANEGTSRVGITATSTGITYTTTGAFCALVGLSSQGNDGDYTDIGTVEVKGFEDLSGNTEGSQINIQTS